MYDLQFIVNQLVLYGRGRYYKESETRMHKDRIGVAPEAADRVKTFLKPDFCYLVPELRLRITLFGKGTLLSFTGIEEGIDQRQYEPSNPLLRL